MNSSEHLGENDSQRKDVCSIARDGKFAICGLDDPEAVTLSASEPGDTPRQWTADGDSLLVYRTARDSVRIDAIDVANGKRSLWKELRPHDPGGILGIMPILIAADGETYAYGFRRMLSETYIIDGLL